jgi:hypothetical protein
MAESLSHHCSIRPVHLRLDDRPADEPAQRSLRCRRGNEAELPQKERAAQGRERAQMRFVSTEEYEKEKARVAQEKEEESGLPFAERRELRKAEQQKLRQLRELQNTDFTLLGGRMAYVDQMPGAQLIYDVRKHHISVFVFQERSLRTGLDENSLSPKKAPYNMETWSQGGLRYFVIGDASAADIDSLAKLFRVAAS